MSAEALEGIRNNITKATEGIAASVGTATTEVAKSQTFDKAAWAGYTAAQLEKAQKDTAEVAKERIAALQKASKKAEEDFKAGDKATVEVYTEKATAAAATTTVATPTATVPAEVVKSIVGLIRLGTKGDKGRASLRKSADGKEAVKKASDAQTMLKRVAKMFGIDPDKYDGESISWRVGEVIRSIEQIARMEKAMDTLRTALVEKSATGTEAAPVAKGKKKDQERTPAKKGKGWPTDLAPPAKRRGTRPRDEERGDQDD